MMSECVAPVSINEKTTFRSRIGINDKCVVFRRWEMGVLVGYDIIKKAYGDKWLGISGCKEISTLFVYPVHSEVSMFKKIFEINRRR